MRSLSKTTVLVLGLALPVLVFLLAFVLPRGWVGDGVRQFEGVKRI